MWRVLFVIAALFAWLSPAEPSPSSAGAGKFGAAAPVCTGGYQGPGDIKANALLGYTLAAWSCALAGTKSANICNSGDANCADVSSLLSGDFDVTTAQGSPLNCGGAGGTCTIKTIYNKGSLGSNQDLTNTTIAQRPTLTFGCANGKACMTGSASAMMWSGNSFSVSQPWSLMAVVNNSNLTSGYQVAIGDVGANGLTRQNNNNVAACFTSGTITATMSDSAVHDEICVANGASSHLYIDASDNTGNLGTTAFGSSGAAMFSNTFGQNNQGIEFVAGAWDSAFSAGDATSMHTLLSTYY